MILLLKILPHFTKISLVVLFVRANLTCADKVEIPYYSSEVFEDVCIHCGNPDNIVKGDEVAGIQPTCDFCWNDESKTRILKRKRKQIQTLQTSTN